MATQYALFSSLYAIPGRLIASQSGRIVEGAARLADADGVLSVFFAYSALLGIFALALSVAVLRPPASRSHWPPRPRRSFAPPIDRIPIGRAA